MWRVHPLRSSCTHPAPHLPPSPSQVIMHSFKRLVGAEDLVVVLMPHLAPLLALAAPSEANALARLAYQGNARKATSSSSSSSAASEAGTKADGGCDQQSGYWELALDIYK